MALTRAILTNVSRKAEPKQNGSAAQAPLRVEVQFNPTEYDITRGSSFAEIQVPGLSTPVLQFVRSEAQMLNVELFLDGTGNREGSRPDETVEKKLRDLRSFVTIDGHLHAPPVCRFQWGETGGEQYFQGVVTRLQEKYKLFDDDGKILRARVTLTMKSYEAVEAQLRKMRLSSPDRTVTRVVREGETLTQIAEEAYGNPRLWWVIAEANDIDRPRVLAPGTALRIPAL